MLYKNIKFKMTILIVSLLVHNTVHAHSGSTGHVHGLFEQFSSSVGIVAVLIGLLLVFKLAFKPKHQKTQGGKV